MAMFVTPAEFKLRWGEQRYTQLFDRDLDGEVEAPRFTQLAAAVDRQILSAVKRKAGEKSELLEQMTHDHHVRMLAVNLLMVRACEGRPEFVRPDGTFLFEALRKEVKEDLADYAKGTTRLVEDTANQHARKRVRHFKAEPRRFIAPSPDKPRGPGNY